MRCKLCGVRVGNKSWWSLINEGKVITGQEATPPLIRLDGTVAKQQGEGQDVGQHFRRKDEGG